VTTRAGVRTDLRRGTALIELESDSLRAVVDPGRGGDVLFVGRPGGPNALSFEPWETPLPAGSSTTYGSGTLDWLSHYRGGWQVMFPNAGGECVVDGVPHPVHGEVSSGPAEVVEVSSDHVVLRSATRLPLHIERRISLAPDRPAFLVEGEVVNDSDLAFSYVWGHHPAIAASPGTRIDLPVGPVHVDEAFDDPDADLAPGASGTWPQVASRTGGPVALDLIPDYAVERICYLPDRPAGWAAVREPASGRGVALAWDIRAFPHLWLWQQMNGRRFPFYGRARLVGIEPVSCWPGDGLARAIGRGQARSIAPRGTATAWITLSLFEATTDTVSAVDRAGRVSTAPKP
jgi:galactose mutarotase-like enzyme